MKIKMKMKKAKLLRTGAGTSNLIMGVEMDQLWVKVVRQSPKWYPCGILRFQERETNSCYFYRARCGNKLTFCWVKWDRLQTTVYSLQSKDCRWEEYTTKHYFTQFLICLFVWTIIITAQIVVLCVWGLFVMYGNF